MRAALIPLLGTLLKSIVTKVIIALGLTFISYSGYSVALNKFKGYISNELNSMPSDILNLLLIGGVGQGFGYLFGAFAFSLSVNVLNRLTFVPSDK